MFAKTANVGTLRPPALERLRQTERRRVSFGPQLSPEQFDLALPPNTPVKKGAIPMQNLSNTGELARRRSLLKAAKRKSMEKSASPKMQKAKRGKKRSFDELVELVGLDKPEKSITRTELEKPKATGELDFFAAITKTVTPTTSVKSSLATAHQRKNLPKEVPNEDNVARESKATLSKNRRSSSKPHTPSIKSVDIELQLSKTDSDVVNDNDFHSQQRRKSSKGRLSVTDETTGASVQNRKSISKENEVQDVDRKSVHRQQSVSTSMATKLSLVDTSQKRRSSIAGFIAQEHVVLHKDDKDNDNPSEILDLDNVLFMQVALEETLNSPRPTSPKKCGKSPISRRHSAQESLKHISNLHHQTPENKAGSGANIRHSMIETQDRHPLSPHQKSPPLDPKKIMLGVEEGPSLRLSDSSSQSPDIFLDIDSDKNAQPVQKTPGRKSISGRKSIGKTPKSTHSNSAVLTARRKSIQRRKSGVLLWSEVVRKNVNVQPEMTAQVFQPKKISSKVGRRSLPKTPKQALLLRHVDSPATIYIGKKTRSRKSIKTPAPLDISSDWSEGNTTTEDSFVLSQRVPGESTVYSTSSLPKKPKLKSQPVEDHFGTKRLLKTPKEKVKNQPVEEHFGTKRLLKTPKEKVKNQPVEEHFGTKRLLKTPKEKVKNQPVEEHFGTKRLLKTPKEKVKNQPVEEHFGTKRLLKTPKEKVKNQPVEEHFGTKRLLKTPKEKMKNQPVEEHFGTKRLLKTPKEKVKNQPVEEHFGTKRLLTTPKEKVKNQPVEEHFGTKRLLKTPVDKVKNLPVEHNFGIKRMFASPKLKRRQLERNLEAKRSPKPRDKSHPIEDDLCLGNLFQECPPVNGLAKNVNSTGRKTKAKTKPASNMEPITELSDVQHERKTAPRLTRSKRETPTLVLKTCKTPMKRTPQLETITELPDENHAKFKGRSTRSSNNIKFMEVDGNASFTVMNERSLTKRTIAEKEEKTDVDAVKRRSTRGSSRSASNTNSKVVLRRATRSKTAEADPASLKTKLEAIPEVDESKDTTMGENSRCVTSDTSLTKKGAAKQCEENPKPVVVKKKNKEMNVGRNTGGKVKAVEDLPKRFSKEASENYESETVTKASRRTRHTATVVTDNVSLPLALNHPQDPNENAETLIKATKRKTKDVKEAKVAAKKTKATQHGNKEAEKKSEISSNKRSTRSVAKLNQQHAVEIVKSTTRKRKNEEDVVNTRNHEKTSRNVRSAKPAGPVRKSARVRAK